LGANLLYGEDEAVRRAAEEGSVKVKLTPVLEQAWSR